MSINIKAVNYTCVCKCLHCTDCTPHNSQPATGFPSGLLLSLVRGLRKAVVTVCTVRKRSIVPILLLPGGWAICAAYKEFTRSRPLSSAGFLLWK